jgi:hypothetical protein
MRLWSLHPGYLDAKGLIACWREGLLARKVLLNQTRGYKNHPQLERFRQTADPIVFIDTYLRAICDEAILRGYKFDQTKIGSKFTHEQLNVTCGQMRYELEWLKTKLAVRVPDRVQEFSEDLCAHPLFRVVPGKIEQWERGNILRYQP